MTLRSWRELLRRSAMAVLPPFNFLTLHYVYFISVSLACSVIFWGASTPSKSVSYADSLFMCVSAITGAGLNTVNLSSLNTFQQAILFVLLIVGHAILISITVLFVRWRAFQKKFQGISFERAKQKARVADTTNSQLYDEADDKAVDPESQNRGRSKAGKHTVTSSSREVTEPEYSSSSGNDDCIQWIDEDQVTLSHTRTRDSQHHHRVFPMVGVGARLDLRNHPRDVTPNLPTVSEENKVPRLKSAITGNEKTSQFRGLVSRNSQFHGLNVEEREKLGGVEYRALSFLSVVVALYWGMFLVLGIVGVGGWVQANHPNIPRENGLSPFWTGAFFAVSAFVNSGMSLLDQNMVAFQTSTYPLITMGMLILAGNTLYPCFLRFIIWTMRRLIPDRPAWETWKVTLDFILNHPRRVYTNLFPKRHTWYLLGSIILLNGIDWAFFEILAIGNKEITRLPTGYRILDGLFQALAVRAGGFYVVTIADLRQGLLVLYVLMMYVSAFPVLVTIRNTNVYEERSLGIYAQDTEAEQSDNDPPPRNILIQLLRHHVLGRQEVASKLSRSYFVHQQLRSQLSHDIWWIAVAVFFIAVAEGSHYEQMPVAYSTFNIIFEVVSAYGCVGVSVGFPGSNSSFCGSWQTINKLILAAVALRGRHRGLPVAIDRAVMLPTESLAWAEEEDAALRREQTRTWGMGKMPVGAA